MQNDEKNRKDQAEEGVEQGSNADNTAGQGENTDETTREGATQDELQRKNSELNDRYLRLYSEYDNYRKRTMREKADIIKTAGEDIFRAILPVIDDFERALRANESATDVAPLKEGMQLIYNKLRNTVQQKGLHAFESKGQPFDADTMEAITHVPADEKNGSGKVVDEIEKGYKLGDKVIRHAKVIVSQ